MFSNYYFDIVTFYRFCFVIYMSVRIRKENTTLEDIAMEIGNNDFAIANAVEMQDGVVKDSGEML